MKREELTEKLLDTKSERGWSWRPTDPLIYRFHDGNQHGVPDRGFKEADGADPTSPAGTGGPAKR